MVKGIEKEKKKLTKWMTREGMPERSWGSPYLSQTLECLREGGGGGKEGKKGKEEEKKGKEGRGFRLN